MEEENDIRWKQRFSNYRKALAMLTKGIEIVEADGDFSLDVRDIMHEGLIQRFEYTLELAWNVMKDYETNQGKPDIPGSRAAIREALSMGIITDRTWMKSINDRNLSTHDYNRSTADEIRNKIINVYHPLFVDFEREMEARLDED